MLEIIFLTRLHSDKKGSKVKGVGNDVILKIDFFVESSRPCHTGPIEKSSSDFRFSIFDFQLHKSAYPNMH